MKDHKVHLGLLPKLLLGILIGMLIGSLGGWFGITDNAVFSAVIRLLATFKSLFATFLQFVIPLLILSFVSVSMAELGKKANKLFLITLGLAYASTVLAGLGAYGLGELVLPNVLKNIAVAEITAAAFDPYITLTVDPVFGVMTALVLAFVLGLGMANIKGDTLLNGLIDLQNIVTRVLAKLIIPAIPYYIASQFAVIAAAGELYMTIKMFILLFVLILITQYLCIILQFGIASAICGKNVYGKIKNIIPAYFTALGTQSSAATIPVNLDCAYKNDISEDVANFVIPLCATIHLAGDTICLVLGAMGIMMVSGMTPSLGLFIPFIFMLGVTMVAAPGVPGGGVMAALGIITSMLGFTETMQTLIISLHFSQDSFGTACNITGDQAIALIVNKIDEDDKLKSSPADMKDFNKFGREDEGYELLKEDNIFNGKTETPEEAQAEIEKEQQQKTKK